MAVGLPAKTTYADGDVFSASDINDTNGTINLIGQTQNFYAGKNKIINGDFGVWQRGTSTTLTNNVHGFGADRFRAYLTFSAGSASFSRQTFATGAAPVAGYESSFFGRVTCGSTSTYAEISQKIEDVRTLAGQTATLSFWAKASTSLVFTPYLIQQFGSGGSGDVAIAGSNVTLTTSWTRYTVPLTIPSISGKTIGTGSCLLALIAYVSGTLNSATIDTWGWQVEAGSTATAFQTATGTIQGELAACQRYFQLITNGGQSSGGFYFTTAAALNSSFPVQMRVSPTPTFNTTFTNAVDQVGTALRTPTGYSAAYVSTNGICILATGMTGATVGNPAVYIGGNHQLSAEL
jgi:hypothetical protein